MRTRLRAKRAVIVGIAAMWLVACGVSTHDSPSAAPGTHLACAGSHPSDAMFTSEPGAGGFTIQAPRLPGWTQQQVAGSSTGFVLHKFDPPTEDSDMGTATITLTAFSPVDTADAALANLRTLRGSGIGWQESSSESIEICGRQGLRVSGVDRSVGVGMDYGYLEFAYESSGSMFPIQISSQLRTADSARYLAEIRAIFDGIRIGG